MSTERNHPRDQNSPQVEAMMNDLRAAAAHPGSPDDTFDIPTGLIPGCDDKLPKSGLLLIYVRVFMDEPLALKRIDAIVAAIGDRLYSFDDRGTRPSGDHPVVGERMRLRDLRISANGANKLAVVTRQLPPDRHVDTMEMEADISLYIYNGVSGYSTLIERGKLRRAERPKDTNRALSL